MVNDSVNYSYELVIAETMEDGMSLLKLGSYDIILLDLGLPDSDGINTFLNVQKVSFETPIIILTGLNVENIAVKAVKVSCFTDPGPVHINFPFRKPFEPDTSTDDINPFINSLLKLHEKTGN